MKYISTRGQAPALGFTDVLLAGLASDGGLYVPETWPQLTHAELTALRGRSYADIAFAVIKPFIGSEVEDAHLRRMIDEAYATFAHKAVVPLKQLDANQWLMELFHGPTLAFKDVAMQLLARLMDHALKRAGRRATIVGATSGDTGGAAIDAFAASTRTDIFILHPHGLVSDVQRRQMTTVDRPNVHNIALEGNFDDCQAHVKAMFADEGFRGSVLLSGVNSINWARIMAQTVYYVYAALQLGSPDRPVAFAVPSGNFGNVFSGYAAREMGLPVDQFIVGTNRNDILARFFDHNDMSMADVSPTLSPSMDIQVSSNFERLLFDLLDRDGLALAHAMADFRKTGRLSISDQQWQQAAALFRGQTVNDDRTKAVIAEIFRATGELLDPHTAIGVEAARMKRPDPAVPVVALATAHPAKFPDAVEAAVGVRPPLPAPLADLYEREERINVLPNDLEAVRGFVRERVSLKGAA